MSAPVSKELSTANGFTIHARFFRPEGDPKAAVLIVPAMGLTQDYYAALAAWLAGQGYLAATFDYAGMGWSGRGPLRDVKLELLDWARYDCDTMLQAVSEAAPGKSLTWLGHSLGGQMLGFVPGRERIAKVVTVAAGSGYWRENVPRLAWKVWWLWYVTAPLATRLLGYFPGRRLRKVGDLPRGVMDQWRRWCVNPEYVVGAEGAHARYAEVTLPITSLSFTDDEMMSARNVESLHGFYTNAPRTMKRIAPEDIGVPRIGHFGFFRPRFEGSLWRAYLLPELA